MFAALPVPARRHFDFKSSVHLNGVFLEIRNAVLNDVGCPCCGPMEFMSDDRWQLNLSTLTKSSYWKRIKRGRSLWTHLAQETRFYNQKVLEVDGGALIEVGGEFLSDESGEWSGNTDILLDCGEMGVQTLAKFGPSLSDGPDNDSILSGVEFDAPQARGRAAYVVTII